MNSSSFSHDNHARSALREGAIELRRRLFELLIKAKKDVKRRIERRKRRKARERLERAQRQDSRRHQNTH
ncbi:hypothetical protein AUP68_14007 [Ilyonectria robusta]